MLQRKADIITGVFQNGWMGIEEEGRREGLEWNGRGQLRRFPPLIVVVVPNCRPEFDLGRSWIGTSTAIRIPILH